MTTNIIDVTEFKPYYLMLIFLVVRDLVWKAIALYRAWQKSNYVRFIFIFIFNTCGILPIIYLILNNKENTK